MCQLSTRPNLFNKEQPANSIDELIDYLGSEDGPTYVYRGQTHDYKSLIPSSFRKRQIRREGSFVVCSEDGTISFENVEAIKYHLLSELMKWTDKSFGNYLSQQYLAQSESIDITEDIYVAAFFATMTWPEYLNPIDDPNELGVIYRFDHSLIPRIYPKGPRFAKKLNGTDDRLFQLYVDRETKNNWEADEFYYSTKELSQFQPELEECFVATLESVSTFSEFIPYMSSDNARMPEIIKNVCKGEAFDIDRPTPYLRPIFQLGGVIQPRMLWKTLLPLEKKRIKSMIWGKHFLGVEDIYGLYGMEAFYFRHTGSRSSLTREILWPSAFNDRTFFMICTTLQISKDALKIDEKKLRMDELVDIGFPHNYHPIFEQN